MDEIKVVGAEVVDHPEIGLGEGTITPLAKTMFEKAESFTPLTEEQLEAWRNQKYPWYKELWWKLRRLPETIDFILSPKYKLEKEHKEIGFGYWDRPVKKYDTWNLSNHMAWILYAQLVRFKRSNRSGVPGFEEFGYATTEEGLILWEEVLDKMIFSFQEILNDDYKYTTEEEFLAYYARIQEGLNLFGKYYRGLWD